MVDFLIAFANFIASAVRTTAPIALGTLACTISERAGIINIGIEGIMLFSGFISALCTWYTNNPWTGLVAGCIAGILLSCILGILAIYCGGQQIVLGIGINLFAPGLAYMIMRTVWKNTGISPELHGFSTLDIPGIKDIPVLGTIVSGYTPVIYLGILAVVIMHYIMNKTVWGLRIRAVGENPQAVATVGIPVYRLRMQAVIVSGIFSGMAGAVMCLSSVNIFINDMTAGSGFMAFAANQFGHWSVWGGYFATLLFGAMSALRIRLQSLGVATQITQMIPYIAVLIGIKVAGKRMRAPAANGITYPHALMQPKIKKKSIDISENSNHG